MNQALSLKLPFNAKVNTGLVITADYNYYTEQKWKHYTIYIQNYANHECNGKCILMFKYWVIQNSENFTDVVTRKHMKAI